MFGLFSQKKNKYVAVIDIGSGSIAGAVVSLAPVSNNDERHNIDNQSLPKILYSTRRPFDHGDLFTGMQSALENTLREIDVLSRKQNYSLSALHCFFASPWQTSRTKIISIEHKTPFIVTKALIDSVTVKEIIVEKDLVPLEQVILSYRVNGYETHNPFGKQVSRIDAALVTSVVPKDCLDIVDGSIHRTLGHIPQFHHSFDAAAFKALHATHALPDDFILLHLHHRITDMMIVNKHIPLEIVSFPKGYQDIIDGIATVINSDAATVISKLRMKAEKSLVENEVKSLEEVSSKPAQEWVHPIETFLIESSKKTLIPKRVFIIADHDGVEIAADIFANNEFTQFMFAGEPFEVTKITMTEPWTPEYSSPIAPLRHDTHISLEALYVSGV